MADPLLMQSGPLAWIAQSLDDLERDRARAVRVASDCAGYAHRLRAWLFANAPGAFGTLPDVVHGLSYVRCLMEHHEAEPLETLVVDSVILDGQGEPLLDGQGEPLLVLGTNQLWRTIEELPPWPTSEKVHGRDMAYGRAVDGRPVDETLYEARAVLSATFQLLESP